MCASAISLFLSAGRCWHGDDDRRTVESKMPGGGTRTVTPSGTSRVKPTGEGRRHTQSQDLMRTRWKELCFIWTPGLFTSVGSLFLFAFRSFRMKFMLRWMLLHVCRFGTVGSWVQEEVILVGETRHEAGWGSNLQALFARNRNPVPEQIFHNLYYIDRCIRAEILGPWVSIANHPCRINYPTTGLP